MSIRNLVFSLMCFGVHAESTCGDLRQKFVNASCCNQSPDTIVDRGFNTVNITALHGLSASWEKSDYVFKVLLSAPNGVRSSQYGFVGAGDALPGAGLFNNGTLVASARIAMDPILAGSDASGPYAVLGPYWLLDTNNTVSHPLVPGLNVTEHFMFTYAALSRFDLTGAFVDIFGKPRFHKGPTSPLFTEISALNSMYMRSIDENLDASGTVYVTYEFVTPPPHFDIAQYASSMPYGATGATLELTA